MRTTELSTPEQLAEVFTRCQESIIGEWRAQASKLLQDLNLDKPTLTDHLPDIIREIIRDLALGREGSLSAEHTKGSPPVHGVQRFHDGLEVGEVVAEYNLLRVAFSTEAERHNLYIVGDAARIINHRIDEAVRLAVTAFAGQQALIRKEQQEEHLAFIAHDLRTPLNAIGLLVQELKFELGDIDQSGTEDLIGSLERNLKWVETLIKKVLDTHVDSKGVSSAFRPEHRNFELWPLVQRLILDLRPIATKHKIAVTNAIPRLLSMYADAGLISQVFQNLLSNAFKYTEGGQITVSAAQESGKITCVVLDNGAGIPPEALSKVFDKLTTDPEKEGTGLGLAIVKQIVEAHGGNVRAESTEGLGAKFDFTIPDPAA